MFKVYYNNKQIILTDNLSDFRSDKGVLSFKYRDNNNISLWLKDIESNDEINTIIVYNESIIGLKQDFKSYFTLIKAGGGLVYNDKGQYLFIRRLGKWDLPKGKKEESEKKLSKTALREVSEECGIKKLSIQKKLITTYHYYIVNKKRMLKKSKWYLMKYDGKVTPTPQVKENITQAKWFDKSQISLIIDDTYPSVVDVINYYFK